MDVDLDAVEALEAVVRTGSFQAAAAELGRAQSAVSARIRALEDRLGVLLFDRGGYRARLTPAGAVLLEEGRELLARARRMEALAGHLARGWEARLEVVIDGILPMVPVLKVLAQLAAEDVPTPIQIKVEFLGGVQRRFERERADLMLVKDLRPGPALVAHALPEVECVLVVGRDHALARVEGIVSPAELHRHVELTVHDPSDADPAIEVHRLGGSRIFYLSDFLSKREALLMGLGFGWMPLYLIREGLEAGDLVEVRWVRGSRFRFTPHLVHPEDRPLGRAGRRFLELITRGLGGEGGELAGLVPRPSGK